MITFEDRREPIAYRLPTQGGSVLSERLGVVAELHWLQYHLGCFVFCASVEQTNLPERLE